MTHFKDKTVAEDKDANTQVELDTVEIAEISQENINIEAELKAEEIEQEF